MVETKCIIKNGWCQGCGKSGDQTAICFYDDPFWFGTKVTKKSIHFRPIENTSENFIKAKKKNKSAGRKSAASRNWSNRRRRVYERDGEKCLCCGTTVRLTLDHIVPLSRGGGSGIDNLQTLCEKCNRSKADRTRDYREVNILLENEKPNKH